jgi:predicted nucleic acid-binding protein
MSGVLVDSNVIIDVASGGSPWSGWSESALREAFDRGRVTINPIIYAELAAGFASREELDRFLGQAAYERENLPWEAAFEAGRAYLAYRRRGGAKTAPLPDFYIGAHALVRGYSLLTRDARRYRTYFPGLELVCPPEA